jgi:hypothetical protein
MPPGLRMEGRAALGARAAYLPRWAARALRAFCVALLAGLAG